MKDKKSYGRTHDSRRNAGENSRRRSGAQTSARRSSPSDTNRQIRDRDMERRQAERAARIRRKRRRNRLIKLVLLIILIILAIAGIFLWKRYSPTKETYDMKKYYGIEKSGQLGITVDNQVVDAQGILSDGKAYVSYEIVRDYINSRFYWDANENLSLIHI